MKTIDKLLFALLLLSITLVNSLYIYANDTTNSWTTSAWVSLANSVSSIPTYTGTWVYRESVTEIVRNIETTTSTWKTEIDYSKYKSKLTPYTKKIFHTPFWLNKKDTELFDISKECLTGESYIIVWDDWTKLKEYIKSNCLKEDVDKDNNDFLTDLFNNSTEKSETISETWETGKTLETNNSWNSIQIDSEVNNLLNDIFWRWVDSKLQIVKMYEPKQVSMKSVDLFASMNTFESWKVNILINSLEVKWLKNQTYYNDLISEFLIKVDKNLKLDSSKKTLAKNISAISYSLSSYLNENLSEESRVVFGKKMLWELKELDRNYNELKTREEKVQGFLQNTKTENKEISVKTEEKSSDKNSKIYEFLKNK